MPVSITSGPRGHLINDIDASTDEISVFIQDQLKNLYLMEKRFDDLSLSVRHLSPAIVMSSKIELQKLIISEAKTALLNKLMQENC